MAQYDTGEETLKLLSSIKKSLSALNKNMSQSLRRLEQGIFQVSALGEVHIKLAVTLMDVLGIPQEERPPLTFPPAPLEEVDSVEKAEAAVNGLLRPAVMSLQKPCREIAKALLNAKKEINGTIGNFDTLEMEVLARQLSKQADKTLDSEELVAYREKIKKWHKRLIEMYVKA